MFEWVNGAPELRDELFAPARAAIIAGDPQQAVSLLRKVIGDVADDARRGVALGLIGQATYRLVPDETSAALLAASRAPGDADALYDAAFQLYEVGLADVAAALLVHANARRPGDARIVTELAACLEAGLRYAESRAMLEASGLIGVDGMVTYLAGYAALMTGDLAAARARLAQLGTPDEEIAREVCGQLAAMIARADALNAAGVALDALTPWHLVINGSLLLHESPHGHDTPMHGRYAYVSDSAALMREGIERLLAVLGDRLPALVVHAPDRASRILARALAERADRPLIAWDERLGSPADALVVAWNLDAVEDDGFLAALQDHAPGQVLFAHASAWVEPFHYAPDVTTFLGQTIAHPWTGGALRRQPDGSVAPADPDGRDDATLAAEILRASSTDGSVTPRAGLAALVGAVRTLRGESAAGLFRSGGTRARQRAGSPVLSARFG